MTHAVTPTPWRRAMGAATALAVGSLALAACGGGSEAAAEAENAAPRTEIRFLYATGDDTWNNTVAAVADAFNAQSETATVALDPLPAGSDYATAMKTMDATGNWPALVDMRDTATYVGAGKLAPIPPEVTSLVDEQAYGAAADGNVYTVPYMAQNGELGINIVYDKAYFEEHDLEVPATYDEFIGLMDAIKANGDVPLATAAGEVWPSDQLWKPLAAPTFAEYEQGFWQAVADGEATMEDLREPLERLKTITDEYVLTGWQSTQDAQTTTLLVNDSAVMATSSAGVGRLNDINKVDTEFEAGMFIVPAEDGTLYVLKNDVSGDTAGGIAISSQAAEDDAAYQASVDFLEYFYSVEAADLMEENGWLSPNIKKADEVTRNTSIPGAEDYFSLLDSPDLEWYQNDTPWTDWGAFNTFFRQSRIEMQDGQTTVDQLIEEMQAEFDTTITD